MVEGATLFYPTKTGSTGGKACATHLLIVPTLRVECSLGRFSALSLEHAAAQRGRMLYALAGAKLLGTDCSFLIWSNIEQIYRFYPRATKPKRLLPIFPTPIM